MARILGRTKDHRTHLLRNLGRSLVLHGQIQTTLPKAKELRPVVERWVTKAKAAAVATGADRLALLRLLRKSVHHSEVLAKLTGDIATRTKQRSSGYLRILRLGTRVGDGAPIARIEFVDRPADGKATGASKQVQSTKK